MMAERHIWLIDKGWRKWIPSRTYHWIHRWKFRGSTRLKTLLGLAPRDVESAVREAMILLASQGSTLVDVGAHKGEHTLPILSRRADLSVVAIEPISSLADDLRAAVLARGVSQRCEIHNLAVGEQSGEANFWIHETDDGYSGLMQRELTTSSSRYRSASVQVQRLDVILEQSHDSVSCVKIDVEGAELAVLKGGHQLLLERHPLIFFECANNGASFYGTDLDEVARFLENIGYEILTISGVALRTLPVDVIFKRQLCWDFVAVPEGDVTRVQRCLRDLWDGALPRAKDGFANV